MAHRLARGAADAEALSPRDANAQRMPKAPEPKAKPAPMKIARNKEHPPPPPAQVPEPTSSDRPDGAVYQVGKPLGKGGFAICHEGTLLPTKQKYALKIVKSQMPSKMESKFQTELQIHSKMRHRNIVQFLRAFSYDKCTYLVLELCPNGSLMDMVRRRKGLTEGEVRYYSVQIAGAIKYMHAKGIIHRDLKMGNIFLDSQMNAKIGDFGLAALHVTGKDAQSIRRTTLCGTPNYIAPEILTKGKKGHDNNVDLWSLGVIIYAMLTSKPPFQSTTTDEIYRRAQECEYGWPSPETTTINTSAEAKSLVAAMLREEENRLAPDAMVQHPFFTSGYMPAEYEMTPQLRDVTPNRQEFFMHSLDSTTQAISERNLLKMCKQCGVGAWGRETDSQTQVWKEMAAEEKAGLTPLIPLAGDMVYRPFDEWVQEQMELRQKLKSSAPGLLASSSDHEGESNTNANADANAPVGLLRQPPQSFAAQQRAQSRPSTLSGTARSKTAASEPTPLTTNSASQSTRPRARRELSREPAIKDLPVPAPVSVSLPASAPAPARETTRSALPSSRSEPLVRVADRAAAAGAFSASTSHKRQKSESIRTTSLFGPSEKQNIIADTEPESILGRLRTLQQELERALNSRTMAFISSKKASPPHPHVVVKWVDYTNKFGLGYILNDGSVGCILRDIPTVEGSKTATLPPAGIFIRGAERHILRRQDTTYAERCQPVPMTEPIKFFENRGETGLSEALVSPEQFRVGINEDGTAGKMTPGKDLYQHRKRERIILWKKFANYMIAYGRDDAVPTEEVDAAGPMSPGAKGTISELVTFYQRFGDVGCWVYCDGHLQFNFPDHTKIVLDATGTWCHFWHLPKEAAEMLAREGTIGAAALDDRAMLSYPLQTLLNFDSKPSASRTTRTATTRKRPEIDPELQGIPNANDFRRKINFIKNVVKEWVTNGGLGNSSMGRDTRLRWTGYREVIHAGAPQKHVWVTIGARWGDRRITTLVNPQQPWELGEDVEAASK